MKCTHFRRYDRGFTLIELMIALGLSAVVSVGLYALSQISSQTFQQQQRISEIQLRLRSAMELLRADFQRAGYMATPASSVDPMVCPPLPGPIQAVRVEREPSNPTPNPADNTGVTPVRVYLTGNYVSTDEYRIMSINGNMVSLQQHTPEYLRIANADAFRRMFMNRMVRVRGLDGRMVFAQVSSVTHAPATGAVSPTLTLATAPPVSGGCAITGLGIGATVAPVSTIEYRIGNVSATQGNAYVGASQFVTNKTDLVRTEMLPSAGGIVPVASTERIVAEYAVDLDVAAVIDNALPGALSEPQLLRYPFGDPTNFDVMAPLGTGASRPHRVRALSVRLSVRERTQDSDFGWTARPVGAPLTRFRVFPTRSGAARVRSAIAEVVLSNVASRNLR